MIKKVVFAIAAAIVVMGVVHWYFFSDRGRFTTKAEYTDLARETVGQRLFSNADPAAILRFDDAYKYIGGQKFILYGVADTEQHFFVEEHPDGSLKSVYWIQYEAYLPGKSYTYDYDDSPLRLHLGDYEFYTDAAPIYFDPDRELRRGTDGSMVREFLASKGYTYPDNVIYARMVYLTDETRQKELMIIFMDDLAEHGMTAIELRQGGAHELNWPEVQEAHLDKIRRTLSITPNSHQN